MITNKCSKVRGQKCTCFDKNSVNEKFLVKTFYCSNMSRKRKIGDVDWSAVENARKVKRVFALKKDEDDCYHCPVISCDHPGLTSKWGCRKQYTAMVFLF